MALCLNNEQMNDAQHKATMSGSGSQANWYGRKKND